MDGKPAESLFWAKYKHEGSGAAAFHPLVCHLLDVMQVSCGIWKDCLGESVRRWLCAELGLDNGAAMRWITFWAAAHDIGKACPGFQTVRKLAGAKA